MCERTNDFEMAAVGYHRNFCTAVFCCFYDFPQLVGEHNRLAANNVEAKKFGTHVSCFYMVCDILDNVLDLIGVVPNLAQPVPFGKAMLAVIVACFGDVPVYAYGCICVDRHD